MNDADFYEGMARNEKFDAKRRAQADNAYLEEARKLNNRSNANNDIPASYDARLTRIEERLDNLYHMLGNIGCVDNTISRNGKLFMFVSKSNVMSDTSITLSDQQFEELMNRILR